ncbi:MAG: trypsin-like peptidase domain-containing protein [Bacteroidia bacterium]|nr:trypsin-like peptidase domain-containing protein [Bacteroidia bacterium]
MKSRILTVLALMICLLPFVGKAQFVYEVESTPDSAKVYVNGVLRGTTPCKVKFEWAEAPDSGFVFRVKKENYGDQVFAVKEKPRVIKSFKKVTLTKVFPHFDLDPESPLIEFDKLLAEFPSGKEVGVVKRGGISKPLTWDGFSRLGSDPIDVKTYDVLGTSGFNTPMKESHQLFSNENHTKKVPRFLLGAKVTKLWIDMSQSTSYYSQEVLSDVKITLEWQVFDRSTNQVVLKGTSNGVEKKKYNASEDEGVLVDAYGDALYSFIAQGKLFELIKNAGTANVVAAEQGDSPTATATTIPTIKLQKFENSPEMVQYSTQSCVTISTDAGHGSGALISEDGYVLTAAHVVDGVNRLAVIFSNGVELEAKVVAIDNQYDIALLKTPGSKYKALPLGQGLTAGLGEEVITIGTPGDIELGQSISKGILSGKRKQDDIVYLQTDVAVSPGNSGGPLMNSKGQIIGVIQRKLLGQGIEGVGFALPIETALKRLNITVTPE